MFLKILPIYNHFIHKPARVAISTVQFARTGKYCKSDLSARQRPERAQNQCCSVKKLTF
jgi:hypothetical protein